MGLDPQLEFSGWDRPANLVSLHEVTAHVGSLEATMRWLAANEDTFLSVAAAANDAA